LLRISSFLAQERRSLYIFFILEAEG